jgi:hypothetical protein
MVARTERAELRGAAFPRAFRHQVRISTGQRSVLLDELEVLPISESLRHGPLRAAFEHPPQVAGRQLEVSAVRAYARRDVTVQLRDDVFELRGYVGAAQT